MQPFSTGTSYVFPVRLSVMVSVSFGMGGTFHRRLSAFNKKVDARGGRVSPRATLVQGDSRAPARSSCRQKPGKLFSTHSGPVSVRGTPERTESVAATIARR